MLQKTSDLSSTSFREEIKGDFDRLCDLIGELREELPSLWLLGSSLLHPRHPIPSEQLKFLAFLRGESNFISVNSSVMYIRSSFVCLVAALLDTFALGALQMVWKPVLGKNVPQKVDLFVKTWNTSPQLLEKPDDFYFGTLFKDLSSRSVSCLFLCGDGRSDGGTLISKLRQLKSQWALTRKMLSQQPIHYVPEWLLAPLTSPLRAAIQQIRLGWKLKKLSASTTDPIKRSFLYLAAKDVLRPFTGRNIIHYYIARETVKRWQASSFVTLYEGHPWESLAWQGAKETNPKCQIIGYQHTIVLKHCLELTRRHPKTQLFVTPDIILCTGPTTQEMMQIGHASRQTQLIVFGSFRRKTMNLMAVPHPERRTIMVLPEGNIAESLRIFDFAMELAPLLPDHRFIFRCHPMLPFTQVAPHLKKRVHDCFNVEVSKQELIEDDFSRSSAILYRGSSAVLYAVLSGLKPFYIDDAASYDMDPLFELSCWRERVGSPRLAKERLSHYAQSSTKDVDSIWRPAYAYVDQYTQPVNDESRNRLLLAIGLENNL